MTREEILAKWPGLSEKMIERLRDFMQRSQTLL